MDWFASHWQLVLRLAAEHIVMCLIAICISVVIAVPIGIWAHGSRRRMNVVNTVTGVLYTVPSIALFALLVPLVGLGRIPTIIGLVMYTQLVLLRAVASGLDSVPEDVRDAANGMGIDPWRILTRIDMPLALPVFIGGLRVATVTVIGIATVGAVVDAGGLGELILQGIQRDFPTKVLIGAISVTILAVTADALLTRAERHFRPWARSG